MAKRKSVRPDPTADGPKPVVMMTTENSGERGPVVEKQSNDADEHEVYSAYVRGARISDIAEKHGLDAQHVIETIQKVESKR